MLLAATTPVDELENPFLENATCYVKALSRLCFPLMLSALSGTLMVFIDRIILAKFDPKIMVAATAAANVFFVFQFGSIAIAMVCEVFVGQFNGAKQWDQVSRPVWQMIWFAALCAIVMIPLGLFGGAWFLPPELVGAGEPYYKWIMLFGPTFPLVSALTAFFIGRGEVKVMTLSIIIGNVLNFLFAMLLVFGIPGWIEPQGAKGAAIATGIAQTVVAGGLFQIFINRHHRHTYHSHRWHFDVRLFLQCVKMGLPNAIGYMTAAAAWSSALYLLAQKSIDHVTVLSIGLSIWIFFSFITEGLQKGVTAAVANCLGAGKVEHVSVILKSGFKIQWALVLLLAIPLVCFPDALVSFFVSEGETVNDISHLNAVVKSSCRWLWLAFLFDGMAWIIDGVLTAAGDTRFIMLMHSVGTWLLCLAPIYLFVVKLEGSPILILQLITLFNFILFASYYLRYRSKKWQKQVVIQS